MFNDLIAQISDAEDEVARRRVARFQADQELKNAYHRVSDLKDQLQLAIRHMITTNRVEKDPILPPENRF